MEVPAELVPVFGAIGGAVALLVRTGARWIRYRMLKAKVKRESVDGPEFGTVGWVYREVKRESGARHALQDRVNKMGERIARLEGRSVPELGPNDTDPTDPPFAWDDEPRTPVEGAIARRRRSRP